MRRPMLLATVLAAGLGLPAPAPACVVDADCPAIQCNSVTCQAGSCVYAPADELALCDDGDKCTLGERCLLGVCSPPEDAGKDSDNDGDCDVDEVACQCDPNDGGELCPLPNLLVGRGGSGFGEVLMTWHSPTVKRVDIATDPSCATAGECTDGRCTRGKVVDVCSADADCDQPPDTCRVIVNWAAVPDLVLDFARLGREDASGFVVKPGCSRKVDVPLVGGRLNALRLRAAGVVNDRRRRDRDIIRFR